MGRVAKPLLTRTQCHAVIATPRLRQADAFGGGRDGIVTQHIRRRDQLLDNRQTLGALRSTANERLLRLQDRKDGTSRWDRVKVTHQVTTRRPILMTSALDPLAFVSRQDPRPLSSNRALALRLKAQAIFASSVITVNLSTLRSSS